MPRNDWQTLVWISALTLLGASHSIRACTLAELEGRSELAPQNFARHFADFTFRFHTEVQPPAAFLAARAGDCDDYATLAAALLRARGFTPRLLSVRMKQVIHVICYVEEAGAYLDFNARPHGDGLTACGGTLPEIADCVAASFGRHWTSVSEFTFEDGLKRHVQTRLAPGLAARRLKVQQAALHDRHAHPSPRP